MTRRSILTVVVAVLGLALSAALAWSASQLAGQRIGLASEPLGVAQGLAPHHLRAVSPELVRSGRERVSVKRTHKRTPPAASTSIFSTPTTTPPPPVTPAASGTPAAPGPAPAPAPPATTSAPAAATRTTTAASSSAAPVPLSSPGTSRKRDDHHPDD